MVFTWIFVGIISRYSCLLFDISIAYIWTDIFDCLLKDYFGILEKNPSAVM